MKAQASLEQMIVIGLALAFIVLAFAMASTMSSDSVRVSQAQDTVERLAAGADYVYSLGPNSKDYISIYVPSDVRQANISGDRVHLQLGTSAGVIDVFANTKALLIGSLPTNPGKHNVLIQYLPTGKILVGEAGIACSPGLITRSFDAGEGGSDTVSITNNAGFEVTGIEASVSGSVSDFSSVSSFPASLPEDSEGTAQVDYAVPASQPSGVYGGYLFVETGNDGSCAVEMTIIVNGDSSCSSMCVGQGYIGGTCRAEPADCILSGEDYMEGNDAACAEPSPRCCCGPTTDVIGPIAESFLLVPSNATTADSISIFANCSDVDTGGSYIQSAEIQLDGGPLQAMDATDGIFLDDVLEGINMSYGPQPPGQHIVFARCTDSAGNIGEFSAFYFNISMEDVLGPIVINMAHSDPAPTTLANITENATATELYTGNNNVSTCWMKVDDGDWYNATPADGNYGSNNEDFGFYVGRLQSGMHSVYARCIDSKGNMGGIFNDTFGVKDADIALVIDRSGSMDWQSIYYTYDNIVSTTSSSFVLVKTLALGTSKPEMLANLSVEIRSSSSGCTAYYEARGPNGAVLASGSRTSTSYGTQTSVINVSAYAAPFNIGLYMRRGASCTVYNRNMRFGQDMKKIDAIKVAAGTFVDITDNSSQLALVSFSTTATLDRQLMGLGSAANKTIMKNAINSLAAVGSTCLECGLDTAVDELISARGRFPNAVRVMIFMTDGEDTTGSDPIAGAVYARNNNITVYTIGFGSDADVTNLINIALLTEGKYYYAPDAETLLYIYQHIGQ